MWGGREGWWKTSQFPTNGIALFYLPIWFEIETALPTFPFPTNGIGLADGYV